MVGFIDYFKGNRTAAFENIISTTLTSQKTDYSPVEKPDEKTSSSSGTHSSLLKLGASGEEVSKVQMKLGLTPTGKYDEATRDAVRSFQSDPSHKDASGNSLVPDGIVGPRTREAMFGSSHSTVKSSATTQVSQENVKVGTHSTISVPPGAKGQVPVFVFYPGIAVNGKIGREYMPPLIKAAVPDWYSKYVIVIPNQHTTPWDNVKTEIDAALSQAGISQKNISIGVFSGSGNNSANISSKVKEIRPRNFIVMDPTPGANLTNSIKSLGSSSNIIMMYNPSNWGNAGYYVGGISNLEGAVSSAGTLDKVSTGHMTIPKEILTKYKSQIERNV
jgi:peptidoglycan hydrolase-like protein with peptidoglycan-binding domain